MSKVINVAVSLNSKYVRYTYVMLTSLLRNTSEDRTVCVYVLHSELNEEEQKILTSLVEAYGGKVQFLFVERKRFPVECPTTVSWSLETYYRLLLTELLPAYVDKILYLDVDVIVNQSLEELYDSDMKDRVLFACADTMAAPFGDNRDALFDEPIRQGFTYFCAGVLLMNITKLRELYCFADYMDLARQWNFGMVAPDQDLLNYMHWREVKIVDANKYNLFSKAAYNHDIHYEEVKEAVAIVHFAGQKPWEGQYVHYDIEQLWWDYAKLTPFYHEMMEEYLLASIQIPTVYDALLALSAEKQELQNELTKSVALCQRLLSMIQEKR